MKEELNQIFANYRAEMKEKNGVGEYKIVIAERKAFLSKKKLTYSARVKIDDTVKEVRFSEMLSESGSGLNAGSEFETTTYNTFKKAREETITEQSSLFGKKYDYTFDFKEIRGKVEELAKSNDYKFEYQIMPVK